MGNGPSIIARATPTGFAGRYVHNSGWPTARIPLLRRIYHAFNRDLDAMTAFLIDQHPAGWSHLGPDPTTDTAWRGPTGSAPDERRFVCYCHGDRTDDARLLTETPGTAGTLADWVYILTPDAIRILTPDEASWHEQADPYGDAMTWGAPTLVPWDACTAHRATRTTPRTRHHSTTARRG